MSKDVADTGLDDEGRELPRCWGVMPGRGRLLGVDFGLRRIGLAVSDNEQTIASPVDRIDRGRKPDPRQDLAAYKKVVEHWGPRGFVVGLPLHADGGESAMSMTARRHAAWLHEKLGLPAVMSDERYTSATAEETLTEMEITSRAGRKKSIDKIAACYLLQAYLDRSAATHDEQENSAGQIGGTTEPSDDLTGPETDGGGP